MAHFPDNHPVALLRGWRKPGPYTVRQTLHRRCVWLISQLEKDPSDISKPKNRGYYLEELTATMAAMEAFDRENLTREAEESDAAPGVVD